LADILQPKTARAFDKDITKSMYSAGRTWLQAEQYTVDGPRCPEGFSRL